MWTHNYKEAPPYYKAFHYRHTSLNAKNVITTITKTVYCYDRTIFYAAIATWNNIGWICGPHTVAIHHYDIIGDCEE